MTAMWEEEKKGLDIQKTKGFEKVMKSERVSWNEELMVSGNV